MTGAEARAAAERAYEVAVARGANGGTPLGRTVADTDPLERYREWIEKAQPGARLVYGSGWNAAKAAGAALAEWFHAQAERRLIHLLQRRREDGQGFDYIAERSSRKSPLRQGQQERRRSDHFGIVK